MKHGIKLATAVIALSLVGVTTSHAQFLRIRDICRVKGQEENTLTGFGLVVGLKGTGDNDAPTLRALAKTLELMGNPIGQNAKGQVLTDELKNAKNVAMVFVTATVPPEGARQGEQLHCTVNAISAKSIEGGYLLTTPLVGPRPGQPRVYGIAQGQITISQMGPPTSGVIHDGARLEEDFSYTFVDDRGYITLVVDRNHASFPTAEAVERAINGNHSRTRDLDSSGRDAVRVTDKIADAKDPVNIRVRIPPNFKEPDGSYDVVEFLSEILDLQIDAQSHDARVVVNERNGVIVVGDNVMVGRVAITHKNISIQTGDSADGPLFVLDQSADSSSTRLQALVDALNALKVSPNDIIDIVKSLERSGDLYGRLIIE